MFTLFPSTLLFSCLLLVGSIMSLSSSQGLFVWAGLEINLLSFIPILMQSSLNQEAESAVKYFLAQALGSGLVILGFVSGYSAGVGILSFHELYSVLIMVGLFIKMGSAPFHFWFPQVMSGVSWFMCLILGTWQKVAPVFLLSGLTTSSSWLLVMVALSSSLVGGIGGFNQTQLRALLAYSSIGHMGWVVGSMILSSSAVFGYFMIYCAITAGLMGSFMSVNILLRSVTCLTYLPWLFLGLLGITLMSLGGLPPLLGFMSKWLVLEHLLGENYVFLSMILLLGSLMNLSYYISILLNMYLCSYSLFMGLTLGSLGVSFIVVTVLSSFFSGFGLIFLLT